MKQLFLATTLLGCSCALLISCSNEPTTATAEEQYATTLAEAKQAWQQAAQRKNAWRDTKKLIKAAEKAAKAGNHTTAHQLARQAKQQGLNAIQQHDTQIGTGNPAYLY